MALCFFNGGQITPAPRRQPDSRYRGRTRSGGRAQREKAPKGTEGACRKCGKVEELGDGLCLDCWDRKISDDINRQTRRPKLGG